MPTRHLLCRGRNPNRIDKANTRDYNFLAVSGACKRFPLGDLGKALRDFFYGLYGYEFERHALEMRASLENLFMTITIGDMLGMPIIPPFYSLRLLPYVLPNIATWKRRVLREREFAESEEYDLHGV